MLINILGNWACNFTPLYARFFTKSLRDLDIQIDWTILKDFNSRNGFKDGAKMSKSKGNVVGSWFDCR